jgi:hypothetical protein
MKTFACDWEKINLHNDAKDGDLLLVRSKREQLPLLGMWSSNSDERFFTVLWADERVSLALPQRLATIDLDLTDLAVRIPGMIVPHLQLQHVRFDTLRRAPRERHGILSVSKGRTLLGVASDLEIMEVFALDVQTGREFKPAEQAFGFAQWSIVCKDHQGSDIVLYDHAPSRLGA